jgi:hypothetical protein
LIIEEGNNARFESKEGDIFIVFVDGEGKL